MQIELEEKNEFSKYYKILLSEIIHAMHPYQKDSVLEAILWDRGIGVAVNFYLGGHTRYS